MHIIICSSRAFVWASEETKENTEQKCRSVPRGEERARLDLGGFYVRLSWILQETFRSSLLNHVMFSLTVLTCLKLYASLFESSFC